MIIHDDFSRPALTIYKIVFSFKAIHFNLNSNIKYSNRNIPLQVFGCNIIVRSRNYDNEVSGGYLYIGQVLTGRRVKRSLHTPTLYAMRSVMFVI